MESRGKVGLNGMLDLVKSSLWGERDWLRWVWIKRERPLGRWLQYLFPELWHLWQFSKSKVLQITNSADL